MDKKNLIRHIDVSYEDWLYSTHLRYFNPIVSIDKENKRLYKAIKKVGSKVRTVSIYDTLSKVAIYLDRRSDIRDYDESEFGNFKLEEKTL